MAAAQYVHCPDYHALILRRTFPQLSQEGGLIPRSIKWWAGTAAQWNESKKKWTFPSGATISFGHMNSEKDKYNYQSGEYSLIIFEELTQFTKTQFLYMRSRLRRNRSADFPVRIRSTSNPGGVGHKWVKARYIDGMDKERGFIQSLLDDNPYLNTEEYEETLADLPETERLQLRFGDWMVSPDNSEVFTNVIIRRITDEEIAAFEWCYNGVDWGYDPDPWAYERCYYDSARKDVYFFDEGYGRRLSNEQTAEIVRGKIGPGENVVCDSAEGKSIANYRDSGLNAIPVKKGAGSVDYAIKWLCTRNSIIIDPIRCPNAAREFPEWEHLRDSAGEVTSGYMDKNNHTIDAGRYALSPVYLSRYNV